MKDADEDGKITLSYTKSIGLIRVGTAFSVYLSEKEKYGVDVDFIVFSVEGRH